MLLESCGGVFVRRARLLVRGGYGSEENGGSVHG